VSYCTQRSKDEGYNSFAFLLWGSEDSERGETWAVDVPLTDLGAEEKALQQLTTRYREVRGLLGSCFCLRAGVRAKPVKVVFAQDPVSQSVAYDPDIVPSRVPRQRKVSRLPHRLHLNQGRASQYQNKTQSSNDRIYRAMGRAEPARGLHRRR
jgi:hypothetical protein